jgi:hypothetical protein
MVDHVKHNLIKGTWLFQIVVTPVEAVVRL